MRRDSRTGTRARKRGRPVLVIVLVLLALLLVAGVALRLYGWRGQRVEGTLTALVNPWNAAESSGYRPSLTKVESVEVDQSCAQPLQSLLADCRAAGNEPVLAAGYLSASALEKDPALSLEDEAAGFSEHEIGLAVDIRDAKTENAAESSVLSWLEENAWRYGFIRRYAEGAEETTGVSACPWHYRYVGDAAAAQIQQLNITLEEYVTLFYNESAAVSFEK